MGERTTFHPGFALSIGYDSNVFWQDRRNEGNKQGAFAAPSAWLNIGNRKVRDGMLDSPERRTIRKVDYFVGASASWRAYLSGDQEVRQAGKVNVDFITRLAVLPGRRFEFNLDEDFRRLAEPRTFPALREFNFNRLQNNAALRFIVRPGGGRLSLMAAYRNRFQFFEASDLPTGDRVVNGVEHETKYRFRDRTGVALRYSFYHTFYYGCCGDIGVGRNEDNMAHRVSIGFLGQVSKRWAVDIFAGWGFGLYKDDPDGEQHSNFSSFIGHGAVSYFPTPKSEIQLRAYRTFSDSLFGNHFNDIGGILTGKHTFRSRTTLIAGVGALGRRYGALPNPINGPFGPSGTVENNQIDSYQGTLGDGLDRQDILFTGHVQVEQALGKFFVLALRYHSTVDVTDFAVNYSFGQTDFLRFDRHMVMLIAAVRY